MSVINGKKPLSQKRQVQAPQTDVTDLFGNPLTLDKEVMDALKAKNLAHRFINAAQLQSMGGYHQYGWRPIKAKDLYANMGTSDFMFGIDPEGYIRRGDLILAVRPQEVNEKHKAYLKQANEAVDVNMMQKKQRQAMRQIAREVGEEMKVHEWDEHDENET